jgi:tripartite-type tricarboxylate transporter receptor subunit TctC
MFTRKSGAIKTVFSIFAFGLCSFSYAQNFPTQPVKIVVPFAPGGSTDVGARIINGKLAEMWGQPVIVDNRGGGNTIIGTNLVAKAPADGYTLLMTSTAFVVNPTMLSNLPYDSSTDLIPITIVSMSPFAIVAANNFAAKSIKELVEIEHAKPGSLSFGTSDPSAAYVGYLFNSLAKTSLESISYKGAAPMMTDLAGGHAPLGIAAVSSVQGQVKAGRVRILGVAAKKPSFLFPDAPALATSELADFDVSTWFALFAPKGTPKEVINKIQRDVAKVLSDPDIKKRFADIGAETGGQSAEEFGAQVQREMALWAKVAKTANIKPN